MRVWESGKKLAGRERKQIVHQKQVSGSSRASYCGAGVNVEYILGIVVSYCLRSRAIHCRKAVLPTHGAARPHESERDSNCGGPAAHQWREVNG